MMINFFTYLARVAAYSLITVTLLLCQAQALPFSLKSLKAGYAQVNDKGSNLVTIAMIYQPDCSWCKKQGKILARVFEQCKASLNLALVGVNGNARQLKKELKHYHKGIPAFIAERRFLRLIGGYQASPTTLIFDANGELIAKKRGFVVKDKLANALDILSHGKCQI